jgi:hypothetical protein
MSNLDSMLERNRDFAAQQSAAGTLGGVTKLDCKSKAGRLCGSR